MSRYFYHNFPRIRPNYEYSQIVKDGLEILKSVKKSGLILAPEIVEWKQPLIDKSFRSVINRQLRISFTELDEKEVEEHGKRFGPFSLEFKIDELRRIGALPVMYIPQHLGQSDFSSIGSAIVAQTGDIKYTINHLQGLKQFLDINYLKTIISDDESISPDAVFNLQNVDDKNNNVVVQEFQISFKTIGDFLSYIGYRNAPFDLMTGILSLVQNLFYPTDDIIHDEILAYYRQREWRLNSGIALEGKNQTRKLNSQEKENLLNINPFFWNKELSDGNLSLKRVDEATVIEAFEGKHISEYITTIRVPEEAFEEAEKIFGDKVSQG